MQCVNKQTNKQLIIDRLGTYANRMEEEEEDNATAVAAAAVVVGVATVAGCCCRRRSAAVVDVGAGHSHVVDDSV